MPRSKGNWDAWFRRREKRKSSRSKLDNRKNNHGNIGHVIGENSFVKYRYTRSHILNNADERRNNPTAAEKKLETILNGLNGGVLKGKFTREHVISGKWIVDFFFHEIRLAVEVDGPVHFTNEQKQKDVMKDSDARRFDITILRLTNLEVFGDSRKVVEKLRSSWREALNRKNKLIDNISKQTTNPRKVRKKLASKKRSTLIRNSISRKENGPGIYAQLLKSGFFQNSGNSKPIVAGKKTAPSYAKRIDEPLGTREDYKRDRGRISGEAAKYKP